MFVLTKATEFHGPELRPDKLSEGIRSQSELGSKA